MSETLLLSDVKMDLIVLRGSTFNCPQPVFMFKPFDKEPQVDIDLQNQSSVHETGGLQFDLKVGVKAKVATQPLFDLNLHYAALFRVPKEANKEESQKIMLSCLRAIFPYVQAEIARLSSAAGFQALNLPPIVIERNAVSN